MPDLSLSTMWAQERFAHMGAFVRAIQRLGFQAIEINYTVDPKALDELLQADQVPFPSLHSPVPKVMAANGRWSNDLNLASLDDEEHRLAVAAAKTTIDWAARVGASYVVLHLGGLGHDALPAERDLRRLHNTTPDGWQQEAEAIRRQCRRLRAERAPAFLARAKAGLHALAEHAARLGVALGLENRYHYHEIPTVDESLDLLADFPPSLVGHWHDVGHAEVLHRLGLIDKYRWLTELANRCLGVHLHDVVGLKDHQAPGQGDADWAYVARHLPPAALRVCEIDQHTPDAQVAAAIPFLHQQGILS
ncbi:MAG: sugar phosphate isomerase/epimerase family protein [Dehalococcoidia bacterium]